MCVGLRGFYLGIALDDSVCVREGLAGITVGSHGVRSRDEKARDHRRRRVSVCVDGGGAPRRRRVDAGVGGGLSLRMASTSARIVVADAIRAVAGGGCQASFLGG